MCGSNSLYVIIKYYDLNFFIIFPLIKGILYKFYFLLWSLSQNLSAIQSEIMVKSRNNVFKHKYKQKLDKLYLIKASFFMWFMFEET